MAEGVSECLPSENGSVARRTPEPIVQAPWSELPEPGRRPLVMRTRPLVSRSQ